MLSPDTTGLITDNTYYNDAPYHRDQAEAGTDYPALGGYTHEILTQTFYDNYDWRSSEGNPLSDTRSNTYDGYLQAASNTDWPYPQDATQQFKQLRGMVTGTKTKVVGTGTFLYAVSFYDDKARMIQAQSTNITGGTDIIATQYSWTGQPLLNIAKNEKSGTNAQTSIVLTQMTLDSLGRVITIEKKVSNTKVNSGSMPGAWTTVSRHEYDALASPASLPLATSSRDAVSPGRGCITRRSSGRTRRPAETSVDTFATKAIAGPKNLCCRN